MGRVIYDFYLPWQKMSMWEKVEYCLWIFVFIGGIFSVWTMTSCVTKCPGCI